MSITLGNAKSSGFVLLYLGVFLLTLSCSKSGKLLKNDKVRIPADSLYFTTHYRNKMEIVLPASIDTTALYQRIGNISYGKFYPENPIAGYRLWRFYENGSLNDFYIGKSSMNVNAARNYDPEFSGNRGIVYFKKNEGYFIDLVGTASPLGGLGTYTFKFVYTSRDTVKIQRISKKSEAVDVYIRTPFPNDSIANFNASW